MSGDHHQLWRQIVDDVKPRASEMHHIDRRLQTPAAPLSPQQVAALLDQRPSGTPPSFRSRHRRRLAASLLVLAGASSLAWLGAPVVWPGPAPVETRLDYRAALARLQDDDTTVAVTPQQARNCLEDHCLVGVRRLWDLTADADPDVARDAEQWRQRLLDVLRRARPMAAPATGATFVDSLQRLAPGLPGTTRRQAIDELGQLLAPGLAAMAVAAGYEVDTPLAPRSRLWKSLAKPAQSIATRSEAPPGPVK